jgi:starch-binding outer membrane protein, SusD/RagB family
MRYPSRVATGRAVAAAAAICALAACNDSVVPDYQSPSIDPTSQSAIQQQVTGIIAGTRQSTETGSDILYYIQAMSSFGRDACNFTNTDSRYLTEWCGDGVPIPNSDFYGTIVWDNEFRIAKNADLILTNLPAVTPAYTAAQANLIKGVVQTWKAYNFMLLAETRDTNGVPVAGITLPQGQLAPILCTKDVWAYITALLDSGEADLDAGAPAGGATGPLPVTLPPGFSDASLAGPSGTVGSFAGFNRALKAKAGLEYAYAVSRSPGGSPATATTPGSPLAAALTSADSAAKASFIFNGGTVGYVQSTATDYADPLAVYHSFSGASGDVPNPVQGSITTIYVLNAADSEMTADPADKRAGKLVANSGAPGQPGLDTTAATLAMTIGTYTSPTSPIPIIRNEDLVLLDAAIQLGLGNDANAVTLINAVRTVAGTHAVTPSGYAAIRDQILHELRMSNILESGEDRTILIRDYNVEASYTTTWFANDLHTTIEPIPVGEAAARNNNLTPSCP